MMARLSAAWAAPESEGGASSSKDGARLTDVSVGAAAGPAGGSPEPSASQLKASTRDEHSAPDDSGGREHADEQFGHGLQFGIRAGITGGYRMIFRYEKSPYCHAPDKAKAQKDQQKFCGNAAPMAVDLALSFAPVDFVEPYAWARFGLAGEASTNTEPLLAFGLGARIYTMSESKFKIFVEPAIALELENGAGNPDWSFGGATPQYKNDFLFHLGVGPQYDFARAFGLYLNAGLTTGVLRYIHTELEVSVGAQLRVP